MSKPQPIYEQGRLAKIEYKNDQGQIHREDGPAIICPDGSRFWLLNSKYHRDHEPAVIASNGYLAWYQDGKRHREDGPAEILPDGTPMWWLDFHDFDSEEQWSCALWPYVEEEQYQLLLMGGVE